MDAMLIECILKRDGGPKVDLGDLTYHFAPDSEGRQVAMVSDPDHIGRFLSITEGYRIPRAATSPVAQAAAAGPIGPVGAVTPVTVKAEPVLERVSLDQEQGDAGEEPADGPSQGDTSTAEGMSNPDQPLDLSSLDKERLVEIYLAKVGKKPHPATTPAKLIELINAASAA